MVHLQLSCFQLTAVWEESAKSFTCVWHKWYPKRETFYSWFQVIEFEQKFALGCKNHVCFVYRGREQYAEKQQNLKLMLMYLTLSPKYKLDDNTGEPFEKKYVELDFCAD